MHAEPHQAPPPLREVAHVAHRLSVSPEHVRRLIRAGELAAIRFGRTWRIDQRDVETYIDTHRQPVTAPPPPRRLAPIA
jgi:excisionase family DNA binding protein